MHVEQINYVKDNQIKGDASKTLTLTEVLFGCDLSQEESGLLHVLAPTFTDFTCLRINKNHVASILNGLTKVNQIMLVDLSSIHTRGVLISVCGGNC